MSLVLWQSWTPQAGVPAWRARNVASLKVLSLVLGPPHSCSFCGPATPSPPPTVADLKVQASAHLHSPPYPSGSPTLTMSDTEFLLSPLRLLLPTSEPGLLSTTLSCPAPPGLPLGQFLPPPPPNSSQTSLLRGPRPGLVPPHSPAPQPQSRLSLLHQWPEGVSQRLQEKATSELSLEAHNVTAHLLCARHCCRHSPQITRLVLQQSCDVGSINYLTLQLRM